jgi:uncharacterized repeat protein (TIGR03837 family)
MVNRPIACDIFCTVIDNFGDIGVAWRLARQLAHDHGWSVRLWVDDLHTFAKLAPSLNPGKRWQRLGEVVVEHWAEPFVDGDTLQIADVVIEAFACDLPPAYLAAMADRDPVPVWINLDYLSSEDWVADFHLKPSPHPRLPLNKWFFFPGLGPHTGGVLIESSLASRRDTFQRDPVARAALFDELGVGRPGDATTVVSLFAYENNVVGELLEEWRDGDTPVLALVPVGRVGPDVARFLDIAAFDTSVDETRGNLTVRAVPFVDHDTYDQILWACDLNFVRGEDSFVRAQLAARPFVWHIYPQNDDAHLPKLDAALEHYTVGLPPEAAQALGQFWHHWNGSPGAAGGADAREEAGKEAGKHAVKELGKAGGTDAGTRPDATPLTPPSVEPGTPAGPWASLMQHRDALAQGAREWIDELAAHGGLAANLAEFAESRLK